MTAAFPFKLEHLKSWTTRRTDGTVTKYVLTTVDLKADSGTQKASSSHQGQQQSTHLTHLSSYCTHIPKNNPVFYVDAAERPGGKTPLGLYVGSVGSKSVKDQFDFVVDCGNVITSWEMRGTALLEGDLALVEALKKHTTSPAEAARILKIEWWDRQAPDLEPAFWPALNAQLHGDVMTCCQGGHGRSGTSFVCLLLCNAPDYDALDAIIHLRAVHCPRAIESKEQHEYINTVATHLGRVANAQELGTVHDYKAAFLALKKPTAVATRKMLGW